MGEEEEKEEEKKKKRWERKGEEGMGEEYEGRSPQPWSLFWQWRVEYLVPRVG